jgi:hypothetical protein
MLVFLMAPLATKRAEAALTDDGDTMNARPVARTRRAPIAEQNTTVAWGWWTRRCQNQQMPYCPHGQAYVSGYNSCGRVWSCSQSYIPTDQSAGYPSYPTVPQPVPQPQYPSDSDPFNRPEYYE